MANGHHDKAEAAGAVPLPVISEAASPRLSPAERGRLARELAARTWVTPDGTERQISRTSIDRWLAAYAKDGLAGLAPVPRSDRGRPRSGRQWLDEAAKLRRAVPARSSAQIVDIIGRAHGVWLSERTVREHLHRLGLSRQALSAAPARAFGRFEAARPNEIWIGDVLHGPFVPCPRAPGSKRAKLFLLVDDYSRLLVHGRWVTEENTRAGQDVLRSAISRRGRPELLYVDNGAPYANHQLSRACAVLGIALVHSKPYAPQGPGQAGKAQLLYTFFVHRRSGGPGHRQFRRAERPVHGLGRAGGQCPGPRRDKTGAHGEVLGRLYAGYPFARLSSPRRSAGRSPAGSPRRRRCQLVRQPLRGRPRAHRPDGRAALRPRRPGQSRRLRQRRGGRGGRAVRDRPPRAPGRAPGRPRACRPMGPGVDYLGLVAAAHAEALGEGSISYRSLPGMEAWGHDDEAAR